MNNAGLNVVLLFVASFLVAQLIKVVMALIKKPRLSPKKAIKIFVRSGGMPSGHACSFSSIAMYLGITSNFSSELFGVSICLIMLVVYDAINVRYATGEQGKLLNAIIEDDEEFDPVKVVEGHRFSEAIVGIILGALFGFLFWLIAH